MAFRPHADMLWSPKPGVPWFIASKVEKSIWGFFRGSLMAGDSAPLPQARVELLEQMTQEHEHFQASVNEFQLWLKAVVEKVSGCLGRHCKLSTKDRLSALQVSPAVSPPVGSAEGAPIWRGLCYSLFNRMCQGPQEIQTSMECSSPRKRGVDLVQNIWGLSCSMEISEPAGHLETQGHSSLL